MAFEFLNAITSCIKYMLIVFNLLFVITGIIIISVGASVQANYNEYVPFLDSPYISIPSLLIAIGVIIFIVAFFGCCGALKENHTMYLIFSGLLICIFILELSAGISGYVLRDRTDALLRSSLVKSIDKYYKNESDVPAVWDSLQSTFECCGIDNYTTWSVINGSTTIDKIPISCCKIPPGTIEMFSCNATTSTLYTLGCLSGLVSFIESHASSLGAAGICIAIVQLMGILFACYLSKRVKHESLP